MIQAIRELPERDARRHLDPRPVSRPARRDPAEGRRCGSTREEGRVELDLRDNPDNYPGGLNESRACATANSIIGLFNSIDPDIPHNAGSFRRVTVLLREGCIAGIPRFPHSCSMATTNVADRLVCITQAAFAELGDGLGPGRRRHGNAAIHGRDLGAGPPPRRLPYVNQVFIGSGGGPGRPERRRLADVSDPCMRVTGLQGQRRGRRAALPDPRPRAGADSGLRGRRPPSRRPRVPDRASGPSATRCRSRGPSRPTTILRAACAEGSRAARADAWMLDASGQTRSTSTSSAASSCSRGRADRVGLLRRRRLRRSRSSEIPGWCCTTCSRDGSAASGRRDVYGVGLTDGAARRRSSVDERASLIAAADSNPRSNETRWTRMRAISRGRYRRP